MNNTNIFRGMSAKDITEQILHLPNTLFGNHNPVDFLFCLKTVQTALGPIPRVIGSDIWCLADKILTASENSCHCYLLQDRIEAAVTLLSNGTGVGRLEKLARLDAEMMMEFLLGLEEETFTWLLDYVAFENCEFYSENFDTETDFCSMLNVNRQITGERSAPDEQEN